MQAFSDRLGHAQWLPLLLLLLVGGASIQRRVKVKSLVAVMVEILLRQVIVSFRNAAKLLWLLMSYRPLLYVFDGSSLRTIFGTPGLSTRHLVFRALVVIVVIGVMGVVSSFLF